MRKLFLLAGMAIALSACATQEAQTASAAPAGRDCFSTRDITHQEALDDRTIKLTARNVDYLVTVNANARQLNFSEPLIVRAFNERICTGNGLGVTLHVGTDPSIPVMIRDIVRAPAPSTSG